MKLKNSSLLQFLKFTVNANEKIAVVSEILDTNKATADLRNLALKPLQDIKKQVQNEQSIPNMHYQVNKADDVVDSVIEMIEKAQNQNTGHETGGGGGGHQPPPAKPVKVITVANCTQKPYLETESDIDTFIDVLKKELMSAISHDVKVRIK